MKKYRFEYSGDREFYFEFHLLSDLRKYLKKVPVWELQNTIVIKNKNGLMYAGSYVRDKRIVVF